MEEVTGQKKAHFVPWPGRKRRPSGYRGGEAVMSGLVREFLLPGFCIQSNAAGWKLTWGFKDSKEGCGGVP